MDEKSIGLGMGNSFGFRGEGEAEERDVEMRAMFKCSPKPPLWPRLHYFEEKLDTLGFLNRKDLRADHCGKRRRLVWIRAVWYFWCLLAKNCKNLGRTKRENYSWTLVESTPCP